MSRGTLLIRADASANMGTGHVMRCLALAQEWCDGGGRVVCAMARTTDAVQQRLAENGCQVVQVGGEPGTEEDLRSTAALVAEQAPSWVVLDGYGFDAEYQVGLKNRGGRLLVVDDEVHATQYVADLVLNQNLHAKETLYGTRAPSTRLLLGPRYALLRREFTARRGVSREIPSTAKRVLVTMGGSDPDNFTARVVDALAMVKGELPEAVVVVGGSNPHADIVQASAEKRAASSIRFVRNAGNMSELMASADVAVSAAGTTCWEMCLLGLPALLVSLAKNQIPVGRELDKIGAARYLGTSEECTPSQTALELSRLVSSGEVRSRMSRRGQELVDGLGARRVCEAMIGKTLHIRRAAETDCALLWEWANEAEVRASSFSQKTIGWEEHTAWFRRKLADSDCVVLIAEDVEGRPVGQMRVERRQDGEGEVDVSVTRAVRGAGYGSLLIGTAAQRVFEDSNITRLHAFIRPENIASARAFEKAGFQSLGETEVRGKHALHYARDRKAES